MVTLEIRTDEKHNILRFTLNDKSVREIRLTDEPYNALVEYFKTKKEKVKRVPSAAPTLDEVKEYFKKEGYTEDTAIRFHKSYSSNEWRDSNEKAVKNWKMKAINVWFKIENKIKPEIKNNTSFFNQ